MIVGVGFIIVGVLVLISAIAYRNRPRPRVTGFDAKTAALLNTPLHEMLARTLARMNGYPEFEWRRFTPLAVSILLTRDGGWK